MFRHTIFLIFLLITCSKVILANFQVIKIDEDSHPRKVYLTDVDDSDNKRQIWVLELNDGGLVTSKLREANKNEENDLHYYTQPLVDNAYLCVAADKLTFPRDFKFGVATSSYQVEGSYNINETIWDRFSSVPGNIADGSSGKIACDSYRLWKEDVRIAKELGVDYYRFSISWSRLLPTGFPDHISKEGKKYYHNLIDGLLKKGIKPFVTIYHWDLPQRLQDLGGWTNPLIADWLVDYSRVAFTLFGDQVKTWFTINEPKTFCDIGYNAGSMAPGIKDPQYGNFLCLKHVLIAHAKIWRMYDKEFRHLQHGKVSFTDAAIWIEPFGEEDVELANLSNDYGTGLYNHPIYSKEGGWPKNVEKKIAEYGKEHGFPRSVLPAFTKEEVELVRGTYDFMAFNYYISRGARKPKPGEVIQDSLIYGVPTLGIVHDTKPEFTVGSNQPWFTLYAPGLRRLLNWLKKNYGDLEYMIMENGYPDSDPSLDDEDRVSYMKEHLEQILLAIEDGVNVIGYTAWSLIDNFEWADGYTTKFGLYNVDFGSKDLTRTARDSAKFYADVIHNRCVFSSEDRDNFVRVCDEL